ncbi:MULTISPECIES: type II toxin-antitoxin system VapC family toxin [unclassified Frankia]|uniref:type II toxin-antitoxin system VapC family toxin n=1 Tax=unclassified Frankia TaxID=2632575 RepID=UPI002AD2C375|nr:MULTISPECIES: type II toxin-antitoxin system VapC family toxin [unclassified Frankia]
MIVDSSALVAIVRAEPDAPRYAAALVSAARPAMSAVNYVEAAVVVDSARDPVASHRFDELVRVAGIDVVGVTGEHAVLARQAYRDFGRGSGSPARLNFGDCFAYALAAQRREPLLFKGADFTHTDLVAADIPDQDIPGQ